MCIMYVPMKLVLLNFDILTQTSSSGTYPCIYHMEWWETKLDKPTFGLSS